MTSPPGSKSPPLRPMSLSAKGSRRMASSTSNVSTGKVDSKLDVHDSLSSTPYSPPVAPAPAAPRAEERKDPVVPPVPIGAKAAEQPTSALAALGAGAAAKPAERPVKPSGAVVGRIGTMLVYVETQAYNAYEPVKVWLIETSGKIRSTIEARAAPVVQKLQAVGKPVVVYLTPVYAKVVDGVVSVHTAVGDKAVVVKAKALELKGACATKALAAYGSACEAAEARRRAAYGFAVAKMDPVKAKALQVYEAGKARALPYYVKGKDFVYPYYMKVQGGYQYVETKVAGMVLKIKVGAGEKAALVKSAVLARYAALTQFIGSYTGPVVAKLAAMYQAVKAHVSAHLSAILAKAQSGKTAVWTKVCDVAVAVKVKSLAVKDATMKYPNAVYVQVKDGYVYMKGVVDGKVVVVKAKLADIANSAASQILKVKEQASLKAANTIDTVHVKYLALRAETKRLAADPNARVTAASAMGGATVMGTGGLVTGGALGAVCGLPLSLFTFGLSIPVGAVIGGGAGMCAGATAGLVTGGAAGHKIHKEKDSIADGLAAASAKVSDIKGVAAAKASAYKSKVADSTAASAAYVRAKFAGGTGGTAGAEDQ